MHVDTCLSSVTPVLWYLVPAACAVPGSASLALLVASLLSQQVCATHRFSGLEHQVCCVTNSGYKCQCVSARKSVHVTRLALLIWLGSHDDDEQVFQTQAVTVVLKVVQLSWLERAVNCRQY
jgi:hypothetical protein